MSSDMVMHIARAVCYRSEGILYRGGSGHGRCFPMRRRITCVQADPRAPTAAFSRAQRQ